MLTCQNKTQPRVRLQVLVVIVSYRQDFFVTFYFFIIIFLSVFVVIAVYLISKNIIVVDGLGMPGGLSAREGWFRTERLFSGGSHRHKINVGGWDRRTGVERLKAKYVHRLLQGET